MAPSRWARCRYESGSGQGLLRMGQGQGWVRDGSGSGIQFFQVAKHGFVDAEQK